MSIDIEQLTNSQLYDYDCTGEVAGLRYRAALFSLGGEGHWTLQEQEGWVLREYGQEVLIAMRIASGV